MMKIKTKLTSSIFNVEKLNSFTPPLFENWNKNIFLTVKIVNM